MEVSKKIINIRSPYKCNYDVAHTIIVILAYKYK